MTVDEAARHLGLTVDAVRKRVQRDQIEHEKDAAGRVRIILDIPDNTSTVQDEGPDTTGQASSDAREELVEELRDRVAFLERELERRSGEAERYQQIVAGLTQANTEQARAIRAIEAPASQEEEPPEAAETVEEEPAEEEPGEDFEAAGPAPAEDDRDQAIGTWAKFMEERQAYLQNQQRRPWWRRVFRG